MQRTWLPVRAKTMLEMCCSINTCSSQEHPSRLHITQSRRSPLRRCAGQHIHTYMLPMHALNSLACTHGGMLKDLAIMLSEESNIHAHPQTHVVTPSLHPRVTSCLAKVHHTTPRGFEPLRAEPNGFRVHLLNRSDTVSCREGKKHKAMHHKTLLDPRQQRSDVRLCAQRSEIHSLR